MAHWSENSQRLALEQVSICQLSKLEKPSDEQPAVYLFWLPPTFIQDQTEQQISRLTEYCGKLHPNSIIGVLTSPQAAASLLHWFEKQARFQLWVAVKTTPDVGETAGLPQTHAALLLFSRYNGSLKHTKTRIRYTYCPACQKTTKDYGGKKHTYHEYGTLMSDVWRDIECNPDNDIDKVIDRLRDVFGLEPYSQLYLMDLRQCEELTSPDVHPNAPSATPTSFSDKTLLTSQLLNGDCLEMLASLPDNSVDFCFADPPYNLKKKYDRWDDALESVKYFEWCDQWLTEMYRVLKPGHTLAVLNIPLWAVRHYQHLASLMRFQDWIVWEALGFPVRMVMPAHYTILCFSKGVPRPLPGLTPNNKDWADWLEKESLAPLADDYCLRASCVQRRQRLSKSDREPLSNCWHDIHRLKHNSRRVDHPCQLPPSLMNRLFAIFTKPGEMILDGFNGAGTSTLTAQQMNRRYIGIELSTQYHELALQRHELLAAGGNPFGKDDSVPKAKNSPVQRLSKQKYLVSKKALQLEVKRIAQVLGRLPNKEEVSQYGKFPIEYYNQYFVSWGEVCAAARTTGMTELPANQLTAPTQFQLFSSNND
ncbi:MAG: DNA methyltransferase [Blastocatellia bacterium]